jgi:hypothetical protein
MGDPVHGSGYISKIFAWIEIQISKNQRRIRNTAVKALNSQIRDNNPNPSHSNTVTVPIPETLLAADAGMIAETILNLALVTLSPYKCKISLTPLIKMRFR